MAAKKINKMYLVRYKKEIEALMKLGRQHDKEKDPDKKAELKQKVLDTCAELRKLLKLPETGEAAGDDVLAQFLGEDFKPDSPAGADGATSEDSVEAEVD